MATLLKERSNHMGSVNRVTLVGHLGNDAKLTKTTTGHSVSKFNMATNEIWKNKDGEKESRTEWHRVVLWDGQAENLNEYLKKGRQIYVEGRLQSSTWKADNVSHKTMEVIADTIRFLGSTNKEINKDLSN